jgi:hypothetical protein
LILFVFSLFIDSFPFSLFVRLGGVCSLPFLVLVSFHRQMSSSKNKKASTPFPRLLGPLDGKEEEEVILASPSGYPNTRRIENVGQAFEVFGWLQVLFWFSTLLIFVGVKEEAF